MASASETVRGARVRAGLTQATLAARLGTTQSAIARLEAPGSNPTVRTLESVLEATGHRLVLAAASSGTGVDKTLIADRLQLTPAERLRSFESFSAETRTLMLAGKRAGAR